MKILVIGGSYFLGRWFVELARQNHEITVLNRGNVPIGLKDVREWKADRHDIEALKTYAKEPFDCIVDFCAYAPGDIRTISDTFPAGKYIYISTVDVYKKGLGNVITEGSPLEDRELFGDVGAYISGKAALEIELGKCCKRGISVRPGIIYGPANYAPREGMFFEWIMSERQIIVPKDVTGSFQFIYVTDAAKGILKLCEADKTEDAYNFCNAEPDNYDSFAEALHKAVDIDFAENRLDTVDILAEGIPFPFPLTKAESEIYDTGRFDGLGINITPLDKGLKKAFDVVNR